MLSASVHRPILYIGSDSLPQWSTVKSCCMTSAMKVRMMTPTAVLIISTQQLPHSASIFTKSLQRSPRLCALGPGMGWQLVNQAGLNCKGWGFGYHWASICYYRIWKILPLRSKAKIKTSSCVAYLSKQIDCKSFFWRYPEYLVLE